MSSVILEAHDLTKEYRHTVALDHIDLKIEKGKIYGFIGQNGAGKTTFLRLVTGLAFPTSGTLSLWGKTVEKELQEQRKRIGCMIETPALFPTMTAYQNMEIQRIQRGIPDKAVIQKTLDMVGLKDTGKKAVRNFSLGMRQRLGIAIALLNTPEFLILDEPINGLDPAGIVEIRNLLKSLNKEYGMTILVSSHILEELYQTASEFILIDKGKIIEEISDRELNDRCKRHIAIKASTLRHEMYLKESIANISHDLRTPLTVILGHLQLLKKENLSAGQTQRIETIYNKAERMKALIQTFYDVSVIDAKEVTPVREDFNLTNLLINLITENAPALEAKGISPVIGLPDHSVYLHSDYGMVERIFQNLIINAIRYSSGSIKIDLKQGKEKSAIFIIENPIDSKVEIDPNRLFERFYTGDKSRHNSGTGVGLAVVKLLTDKLGGNVFAKIENDTLTISLEIK